jgi:hydrogenase expression/formation protein HypD
VKPDKIIEKFKDAKIAKKLLKKINSFTKKASLMEVCGTHTVQIFKTGIRSGLNKNIKLLSGPGCPVCVTTPQDIDKAIAIAGCKDVILCCFGDMVRVPGSEMSLDSARAKSSAKVKIMYSPIEALQLAKEMPDKKIVMFGVGFETTIPAFASVLIRARKQNINNLYLYPVFKLVPPALRALLESKEVNIDGFILPGHVSAIIGEKDYRFIAGEFNKPAVIAGFEPVDILKGISMLLAMIRKEEPKIKIEYSRSVKSEGNKLAREIIYKVFEETDVQWRGVGKIKKSGLKLKKEFSKFCVDNILKIKLKTPKENPACICSGVIMGIKEPLDCKLYAKKCTPENPVGPCMVSGEGTCAAYYKYSK